MPAGVCRTAPASKGYLRMSQIERPIGRKSFNGKIDYLPAELRCAAIRARLWQQDIEAVGLALKGGLVNPEQALELLAECDCLQLVGEEPRTP
jgi:hypothetical protein